MKDCPGLHRYCTFVGNRHVSNIYNGKAPQAGLHKLCHPTIRDGSMWSKFVARGEHGDVFLFSNLDAL